MAREQCEEDEGTGKGAIGGGRRVSRRTKKGTGGEGERTGAEIDRVRLDRIFY